MKRPRPRPVAQRSRAMLLAMLLVGTLALATMLAYEAHDASRSHRATAERALNDYAAVAAWELVAGVNDELQSTVGGALAPLTHARATTPYELLAAPRLLASSADGVMHCATPAADSARTYFRVDFRDGSLATDGPAKLSPTMQRWLVDTVTAHARATYQPDWSYAIIAGGPRGESSSTLAYAVKYAEHRAPIAAYGVRTCAGGIGASMIRAVMAHRPLLPATVTGGTSVDSLVSVIVTSPSGAVVFQSPWHDASLYVGEAPIEQAGALRVRVTIRPHAVQTLALALPQSRIPILVGLLTITAAMVGVTVLQLKREHELSRLRSDFISSVSHELRTPLSQILLFAETLNLGRVRTEQERHTATDVIVQEGRRLMHLVENILHFSRAERRMTRLGPERLNLSAAVRAIVDDWMPLATAEGVTVQMDVAPNVEAVADRSALRQIVLNLLDNAVKYGPPAQTVTVETRVVDDRARIAISDEGEGIPLRERERVWASFYRLDKHANSSVAGSGIGLFVVRELARLQGGDAWIEDSRSGGARVVVDLQAPPSSGEVRRERPTLRLVDTHDQTETHA
ncbi:MAG TPA: HAMP domain-containing sensor histidine kinase [Gemmatimonadaceae bacterium]